MNVGMPAMLLLLFLGWEVASSKDGLKWNIYNCNKAEVAKSDEGGKGPVKVLLDARRNQCSDMSSKCFAIQDKTFDKFSNYEVRVDMLNVASVKGVNFGHLGVVFNFVDESNFDFLFLRYE